MGFCGSAINIIVYKNIYNWCTCTRKLKLKKFKCPQKSFFFRKTLNSMPAKIDGFTVFKRWLMFMSRDVLEDKITFSYVVLALFTLTLCRLLYYSDVHRGFMWQVAKNRSSPTVTDQLSLLFNTSNSDMRENYFTFFCLLFNLGWLKKCCFLEF